MRIETEAEYTDRVWERLKQRLPVIKVLAIEFKRQPESEGYARARQAMMKEASNGN